jgi:WD40 repeat protein/tRNA A-37 threonylcarbamoyl transferase component Bud32
VSDSAEGLREVPPEVGRRIEAVCRRFEAVWRTGQAPCLEDYVGGWEGPERAALLRELVPLDADYRAARGEAPTPTQYLARFPDLDPSCLEDCPAAQRLPGTVALAPGDTQTLPLVLEVHPQVGDYELLEEIARGGMGVVYKARQTALKRIVALKMVLAAGHEGTAQRARFRTEAEAVARLQHPNIVQIYEVGEHQGLSYFSMEYCPGGSLAAHLNGTPLPPREAAMLVEKLAGAIQAAHDKGVIHRDLKPANVLLAEDGTPKITDFGLAKKLDEAGQTQTGAVMGTPSYMAPEQAEGKKDIGPACDVYALGAILYELLTGRPPFKAATPLDTIRQVVSEEPVPPRQLQSKTPRDLETICLKCLLKEPNKRYSIALALAEDLRRFQKGEPITARSVGKVERGWRWCRRNPVVAALAAGVAALAAGVALVLLLGLAVSIYFAIEASRRAGEETVARAEAEQHLRRVEGLVYAGKLALAQRAFENNYGSTALQYLEECQWDQRGWEHDHLWTRFNSKQTFLGHTGAVTSVCFSPDGKRLASASGEWNKGEVKVWDASTGQEVLTLTGHTMPVTSVCFSPDGKRLASASWDQTVKVWDAQSGQEILTLTGHTMPVTSVCFSPDGKRLASASDKTVNLWDAASGQQVSSLTRHNNLVHSVCFSPDGKRLASASRDETVTIWDGHTGQYVLKLRGHTSPVISVCFSPDGKHLASASNKTVKVWNAQTWQEVLAIKGPSYRNTPGTYSICFSPDGKRLASPSGENVMVWDVKTGQILFILNGHAGEVYSACFSPDGKRLASASSDKTVRTWDAEAGQQVLTLKGHYRGVNSVCFSPDGKRLASAAWNEPVRVWDTASGQEAFSLKGHTGFVTSVSFSPDGKRLASASWDQTVKVWDAASGQNVLTLKGHTGPVTSVCFSPDGKRLASASDDKTVKVWDAQTGDAVLTIDVYWLSNVCFSPDGKRLATHGNMTRLWDVVTGKFVTALRRHSDGPPARPSDSPTNSVVFSPDGKRLAAVFWETVVIWDVDKVQEILALKAHTRGVSSVCFSPDGKRIATANGDHTVRIWNTLTGDEVLTLTGHTAAVTSVCFSPNGKRLASASDDQTVKVWDAASGQEEHEGK